MQQAVISNLSMHGAALIYNSGIIISFTAGKALDICFSEIKCSLLTETLGVHNDTSLKFQLPFSYAGSFS